MIAQFCSIKLLDEMKSMLERISAQLAPPPRAAVAKRPPTQKPPRGSHTLGYEWKFAKLSIAPKNGVRQITSSKVHLTKEDEKSLNMAYQKCGTPASFALRLMRHLYDLNELTDPSVTILGTVSTRPLHKYTMEFIRKQIEKRSKPNTWQKCLPSMSSYLAKVKRGRREGWW